MIPGGGAGLLLHVTSLPSRFGIGDTGPAAYRFVSALSGADQTFWQVLPLHPTLGRHHYSPYHATSVFALNPLLIESVVMVQDGFVDESGLPVLPDSHNTVVDFEKIVPQKMDFLLKKRPGRTGVAKGTLFMNNSASGINFGLKTSSALVRSQGADWSAWPQSTQGSGTIGTGGATGCPQPIN